MKTQEVSGWVVESWSDIPVRVIVHTAVVTGGEGFVIFLQWTG